jgi:beta-glucanase (GH16 family)
MRISKNAGLYLLTLVLFFGCKKAGADSVKPSAPANLQVSTVVSTNGSGNVAFTASAENASSYSFEFGDGVIVTQTSGVVSHQYTLNGTNTFSVIVTAKSANGQSVSKTIAVTVTVQVASPTLFWSEEFNTNGAPNSSVWGYDIGTGSGGWGNQELQYYTNRADNVIVANGVLKITAKRENFGGMAYTSTRLLSKDKFSFKYGRVDVSAKLPAGGGTWPAIWMLGSNFSTVGWPACGEIDIMEHKGNDVNRIYGTVHYPGRSGGNPDGSTKVIANATTEFHLYSMEWTASSIKFYVDNQLFHTVSNSTSLPFNQNFFLILNVAMGGTFGGAVDPNFSSATMEIDYIRIYK